MQDEDNELDTVDGKPIDEVDTEEVDAEKKVEDDKDEKWDKTRQQIDQMKASQRKLAAERDTLANQMASQQAEIASLRDQIKVNQERKIEIKELDPNSADVPEIVNQNKVLIAELSNAKERLAKLETLASRLQTQEVKTEDEKRREKVAEEILSELDSEFGAKYRAKAKKMADDLVDSGQESQPSSQMQAYKLVRRCYQELAKNEKKPVRKVSSDNGAGTVSVSTDDIKEGSRQEVLTQLRKKFKT